MFELIWKKGENSKHRHDPLIGYVGRVGLFAIYLDPLPRNKPTGLYLLFDARPNTDRIHCRDYKTIDEAKEVAETLFKEFLADLTHIE